MKVRDLIEELKVFDGDMEVLMLSPDEEGNIGYYDDSDGVFISKDDIIEYEDENYDRNELKEVLVLWP